MCGISACSSASKFSPDKLRILMMYNESRGIQSCGLYTPEMGITKVLGRVSEKFLPSIKIQPGRLAIGHMRFATKGAITKDNSHPFEYGKVIGVHNGVVDNWYALAEHYEIKPIEIDVDSQILFRLINEQQDIKVLKQASGHAAVVYTKGDGTLYCYRFGDRPLFRGTVGDTMYISSVEDSLKAIDCSNVKEFAKEHMYEIKKGKIAGQYPYKRKEADVVKSKWAQNNSTTNRATTTNFGQGPAYNNNIISRGRDTHGEEYFKGRKYDEESHSWIPTQEWNKKRIAKLNAMRAASSYLALPPATNNKEVDVTVSNLMIKLQSLQTINTPDDDTPKDNSIYEGISVPIMDFVGRALKVEVDLTPIVPNKEASLNTGEDEEDETTEAYRSFYGNEYGYWSNKENDWIELKKEPVKEGQDDAPFLDVSAGFSSKQSEATYDEELDKETMSEISLGKVMAFMNNVCIELENANADLTSYRAESATVRATIAAELEKIKDSINDVMITTWAEVKEEAKEAKHAETV